MESRFRLSSACFLNAVFPHQPRYRDYSATRRLCLLPLRFCKPLLKPLDRFLKIAGWFFRFRFALGHDLNENLCTLRYVVPTIRAGKRRSVEFSRKELKEFFQVAAVWVPTARSPTRESRMRHAGGTANVLEFDATPTHQTAQCLSEGVRTFVRVNHGIL